MLAKKNRLTKEKEFKTVFRKSKSSFDDILGVKVTKNKLEYSRFGIIVSSKVSKKAVERNKIKRRLSNLIRLQKQKIIRGFDCVIIVLPPILNKKLEEISQSLDKHFKKLKLYQNA